MEKNLEKNSQKEIKNKKSDSKKRKDPFRYCFFDFVKITGALPVIIYLRNKYIYESKDSKKKIKKGALVCANHTSMIDPVALHCAVWYRRLHIVATQELFKTKRLKWFFTKMLCIPINKENVNISSFKDIISTLKEEKVVGIFPEGHINSNTETVDFFKSGVILMAIKAGVPIIPMYIEKREKWYQRQIIVVGEPIEIKEKNLNLEQINELSKQLREKEVKLMEICNNRRKKK